MPAVLFWGEFRAFVIHFQSTRGIAVIDLILAGDNARGHNHDHTVSPDAEAQKRHHLWLCCCSFFSSLKTYVLSCTDTLHHRKVLVKRDITKQL